LIPLRVFLVIIVVVHIVVVLTVLVMLTIFLLIRFISPRLIHASLFMVSGPCSRRVAVRVVDIRSVDRHHRIGRRLR